MPPSALLDDHGPDALQTRKVASAAGTSTMAVYTHFGGMRGLIAEVAEEGLRQFDAALTVPQTADPVADLLVIGAAYRRYAIERPHMYRLMFGSTSAHGINAPVRQRADVYSRRDRGAHPQLRARGARCAPLDAGGPDQRRLRGRRRKGGGHAAQFWALIHGFVMLELAGYYGEDGAAVRPVLGSLTTNLFVALGDSPERVQQLRSRRCLGEKTQKLPKPRAVSCGECNSGWFGRVRQ